MTELDQEAWDRWVAFRKAIKKPIKEVSEHAAKLKLSRFGADQDAVVQQSIANGWQGLFPLKTQKGEKPVKTDKQIEADRQALADSNDRSIRYWDSLDPTPFAKLKLCEALWARYTVQADLDTPDRLEWLKGVIALHLREASAREVVDDPALMSMVWCFFGERGAIRIKDRAKVTTQ